MTMTPMKLRCWWTSKRTVRPRQLLVQANRNGFLYVLDRTNGKFLSATPFVEKLNWATGIDASGRPILSGRIPTAQGTYICPGINGATNWFSPSYNPDTGLFYVMALESCNLFFPTQNHLQQGETYYNTGTKLPPDEHAQKILLALFGARWESKCGVIPRSASGDSWGGTLTTAGGLVFFGDDTGSLGSSGCADRPCPLAFQYWPDDACFADDLHGQWRSIRGRRCRKRCL